MKVLFSIICLMTLSITSAKTVQLKLTSRDGTMLNGILTTPESHVPVRGSVLVIHGLQSHVEWHRSSMEEWAKHGIMSLAFDRRGSGKSEGMRGHFESKDDLQEDADAAFDYLKTVTPQSVPVYVFANSFGFMVSVPFSKRHANELQGLVLLVPASAGTKESDYTLAEKARILTGCPRSKHSVAYPNEFITSSPEGLLFMKNDKLMVNKFTSSFLRNTLIMRAKANYHFPALPLKALVILARKDRIVDLEETRKNLKRTGTGPSGVVILDGEHDLNLSGLGADVNRAVVNWLIQH